MNCWYYLPTPKAGIRGIKFRNKSTDLNIEVYLGFHRDKNTKITNNRSCKNLKEKLMLFGNIRQER